MWSNYWHSGYVRTFLEIRLTVMGLPTMLEQQSKKSKIGLPVVPAGQSLQFCPDPGAGTSVQVTLG